MKRGIDTTTAHNILVHFYDNIGYADDMLANTAIVNWYNSLSSSTIKQFYEVDKLIAAGNYQAALSLNNSISTTLLPEINQKSYNLIYCNRYIRMQSIPNH